MFHGTITEELISHEEWSHYNQNIIEDQKDFVFVKFNGLHLKSMENLQSCISLRVCIFSNNFITDISALQSCLKLIKLDLHGNQIKHLPDDKFWSRLKNLKLLYLHDNGFANLQNVCMLSACPSLVALTMFDCPVSLNKGYRQTLVNNVCSLKALDHHVISDEEIIQNWHLPERFRTYNHRLFFNFCPALKKGSTYMDEINNIKYIISKINGIMAHNSPVLIIQRWIRGFLVRKYLSSLFLYKKHQRKFIRKHETKLICAYRRWEDKDFKDLIFKPGTNITGKLARWKHSICFPAALEYSSKRKKKVFAPSYELKTKDIGKKQRDLIQKDQESEHETEDEGLHASFRISVLKPLIHSSGSLKYAAVLKEKQDSSLTYATPFPTTPQKPVIKKKHIPLEKNARREFFTAPRTTIKLKTLSDTDKYYLEQKKLDSHKKKVIAVAKAQAAEEKASLTVQETLHKKRHATRKQMAEDKRAIQAGLYRLWQDKVNYLEKVRERRALFLEEKEQKAKERLLILQLNNERTVLTKGINKIDRLKKNETLLKEKCLIVKKKVEAEKYQKKVLKYNKELRAQEAYKRHCEEKFVLDTLSFQKASERLQDAKARVAMVKANLLLQVPSEMTE
ncbi:leucine rich repeats and IQ motif containing 3 [Phyllostomus discolor]|uniref:Leucine rich repeats and IQ motif containing 3 n=1 Tax=Phyllostomus discolor TaxID=89673 RepID=A0A6J2LVB0_9CHIR|nr:leucine-rich repeat and IQ domain-containing protein 3 [Phyllostomus discolor]KAF6109936.1 leucine rich repeats and IQ motif containing 3 [Phyllostomus discolor]